MSLTVTAGLSRKQREMLLTIIRRPDQPWPRGRPAGTVHCVFWPLGPSHPSRVVAASRSRTLRRLEARGLVVRHRGQRDTFRVSLTPAGLAEASSLAVAARLTVVARRYLHQPAT